MKVPMSEAIFVLESNERGICTVAEWAELMGYVDPKYFSRNFRNYHKTRPKEYIKEKKIELFNELIQADPTPLNYEIALELGLKDEVSLYKYIKRHTGKEPTYWKKNGSIPLESIIREEE